MSLSDNEMAIVWKNTQAIQQGTTYGKREAKNRAESEGKIHAPAGYTSWNERNAARRQEHA